MALPEMWLYPDPGSGGREGRGGFAEPGKNDGQPENAPETLGVIRLGNHGVPASSDSSPANHATILRSHYVTPDALGRVRGLKSTATLLDHSVVRPLEHGDA